MKKYNIAILSNTTKLGKHSKDKDQLRQLYIKSGWAKSKALLTLEDIQKSTDLLVVRTDQLVILDFDTDLSFQEAIEFNDALSDTSRCNYIVKSTRQGGHFYFDINPDIAQPGGHTKQAVVDILTTSSHNAIGASQADEGKIVIEDTGAQEGLNIYNETFNTLVTKLVLQNMPATSRAIVLRSEENHSDDNINFIKSYISNIITDDSFNQFYNIPNTMPPGSSNATYLRLSTRLATDETIDIDDYLATMGKFNSYHGRKSESELRLEITDRMVKNLNGLWRFNPGKLNGTYTTTHKKFRTNITTVYDINTNEYLLAYLDDKGIQKLHTLSNKSIYIDALSKLAVVKRAEITNKADDVTSVDTIRDYKRNAGFDSKASTFNKAFINDNLTAFHGTKPEEYKEPTELLEMMQYMWQDEYQYLLDYTKYRYSKFEFSPVVTYFNGVEGSGKDLSIAILSAGFSERPQLLDYQLMTDKHSNWQIESNAIFSEIGSWRASERSDLLGKLKTISGSNGTVTYRGMQQSSVTQTTLIKIWITGNEWLKLHTDPITQRRIHVVWMPRPLETELGGVYTSNQIADILAPEQITNFYYWLGNVHNTMVTQDHYKSAVCRQKSRSYETYLDNCTDRTDIASQLIYSREYKDFERALSLFSLSITDLDFRYLKGMLIFSISTLKEKFHSAGATQGMAKIIDRVSSEFDNGSKIKINKTHQEKYISIINAPANLSIDPEGGKVDVTV